jgi:transposase
MSEGAPHAIQVADRFHLIQNLAEALERAMETQLGSIKAAEAAHLLARAEKLGIPLAVRPSKSLVDTEKEGESEYTVKRRELHRKIWELFNEGWSTAAIANELDVKVRLVQRDLTRPAYFNNRGQSGKKLLDHHRAFIIELWKSGTRSHTKLLKVLKEKGYEVSAKTLYRFLKSLVHKGYLPPKRNIHQLVLPDSELRRPALTPKRAAWLVLANQLEVDEQELLGHLREQNVHLRTAVEVGEGFARLLRQRLSEEFDEWLKVAENCSLEPLQRFATGLRGDYDAIKAAMTLSVSNGQVEGQVNRLKMLKRQMYGRASLGLLRRRFLLTATK